MLKQVLILLIGVFFVLSGVNHFANTKLLAHYAGRQRLPWPRRLVRASGVLLMASGIAFLLPALRVYAVVALTLFLGSAMFLIHHFWACRDRDERLSEALHFAKNLLIAVELIYIEFG